MLKVRFAAKVVGAIMMLSGVGLAAPACWADASTPSVAPPTASAPIHPLFNASAAEVRTAFRKAEADSRNRRRYFKPITVKEFPLGIPGYEDIRLVAMFMPPLEIARSRGSKFGTNPRPSRGDTQELEQMAVNRATAPGLRIQFDCLLDFSYDFVQDEGADLPVMSFELETKNGKLLKPTQSLGFYKPGPRDLLSQKQESSLQFSLVDEVTGENNVTADMTGLTLIIKIGSTTERWPITL